LKDASADTFDVLRKAASAPSIGTHLDMFSHMIKIWSNLTKDFPKNERFKQQLEVLTASQLLLKDFSKLTHPSRKQFEEVIKNIQQKFSSSGVQLGEIDLFESGLLDERS